MKTLVTVVGLMALLGVAYAQMDACYADAHIKCGASGKGSELRKCNAKYGGLFKGDAPDDLSTYVSTHLEKSFQYLLMSSHFGNYQKNRPGFEKLYRSLSDTAWEDAIELIKYVTKRGGTLDFFKSKPTVSSETKVSSLYELQSLARAVDIQKELAEDAHAIHQKVSKQTDDASNAYDPDAASFLENVFLHKHSEVIRKLSGHTNDLRQMLTKESETSLAVFLFDQTL